MNIPLLEMALLRYNSIKKARNIALSKTIEIFQKNNAEIAKSLKNALLGGFQGTYSCQFFQRQACIHSGNPVVFFSKPQLCKDVCTELT